MLVGIDKDERRTLSGLAAAQNISIADVVRTMLCQRYGLHCKQMSDGYDTALDKGAVNLLLRLPPKLTRRLERERVETGRTKREIILETIRAHNEKGEQG